MPRLTLRTEHLAELTTDELAAVAGGTSVDACVQATVICVPTHDCTGYYPSINAPCTE